MALPTRIGRLRLPVLCFVVGPAELKDGDADKVEKIVTDAVAGGVSMVILRDHQLPAGDLLALARRLKTAIRGKALIVINDRADIAQAMEADGVALPEAGLPTRVARDLVGRYQVVGRSVHDVEAAQQASRDGAEFVIAGTIYKSTSHPDVKPAGAGMISEITKDHSLPVIAIGGITAAKVPEVIEAGAAGVAVISAITGAENAKAAAEELAGAIKEAWAARNAAASASA